MKKMNYILFIGILSIVLILVAGCSKHVENILGPEDPCPECPTQEGQPYFDQHFEPGTFIHRFRATEFEVCANDTVVLDGTSFPWGPLVKVALKDLRKVYGWYELDVWKYNQMYGCVYTRVTFIYGKTWHYHDLVQCEERNFELINVDTERPDNDQWFELLGISVLPPPPPPNNDSWVNLVITPENTTIYVDAQLWGEGVSWLAPGSHSVTVSKSGYTSQTVPFVTTAGETTLVVIDLSVIPPVTQGLKVEFIDGKLIISGTGFENWKGAECYNPVTEPVNWWGKGSVVSGKVEIPIRAGYTHIVLWKDAVSGYQNTGGSGILPRFSNHTVLEKGVGVVDLQPGYIVISN